jgi:hypothetical protein
MGYAIVGWILCLAMLGVFVAWTLWRGRRLSKQVPAEQRRWM